MSGSGDRIGERGESIFRLLITEFDGLPEPRFHPVFLGDKHPGVDFLVGLTGTGSTTPFFFAQVKATRQGYRSRDGRLKMGRLSREELLAIARYPAPTYLFGIDVIRECGFILSVNEEEYSHLNGFPTAYPINPENRSRLWHEVKRYWERRRRLRSCFTDPDRSE